MTTGMTADEIAAAVAAANALADTTQKMEEAPPTRTAADLVAMERARLKRERRAAKLQARAEAGALKKLKHDGVQKIIQFELQFDAMLPPHDAEFLAKKHLREIGLGVYECLLTGVRRPEIRILRGDGRDVLEIAEFHARVRIPYELLTQFESAAAAAAEQSDESPIRDTEAGGDAVAARGKPE
jgi:hypothetical protein